MNSQWKFHPYIQNTSQDIAVIGSQNVQILDYEKKHSKVLFQCQTIAAAPVLMKITSLSK